MAFYIHFCCLLRILKFSKMHLFGMKLLVYCFKLSTENGFFNGYYVGKYNHWKPFK